jgi:hypothetical protein
MVEKYERAAKVSRIELRVCQDTEAQAHQEEILRVALVGQEET